MEEAERMERRERDKRERAKMSLIQKQEPEPEMLFSAPFRVSSSTITYFIIYTYYTRTVMIDLIIINGFLIYFPQRTSPTETDRRIQSKLGDFQSLKQLIERDSTHGSRLVGVSSSQMRSSNPIPSSLPQQQVSFNKIKRFVEVFD